MDEKAKKDERGSWIIGGCTMIGMGLGFIFLKQSALYFVACLFFGIGLGLVLSGIITRKQCE